MLFHSSLSVGGSQPGSGEAVDLIEIGQLVKRIASNSRVASHLERGSQSGRQLSLTVDRGGSQVASTTGSTEAQLRVSDHETTEGKVGSAGVGRWHG